MNYQQLQAFVESRIPEAEITEGKQFLEVIIPSHKLKELASELNSNKETAFDFLYCLTGADWNEYMMVIYHLRSTIHPHSIVLKAKIDDRENPEVETVSDIWRTAEFNERETYDFFGIVFQNHPDMRRIFLEDDWVGFPLRKDYVDEINIIDY